MADVKTAAPKHSATHGKSAGKPKNSSNFLINLLIVVACIVAGYVTWKFVLGSDGNFSDAEKMKAKGVFGLMYQGGFVVPILLATLFTLLCFVVERALTIIKAKGKMDSGEFVRKVQYHLANKNMLMLLSLSATNRNGSVGNVMRAGLDQVPRNDQQPRPRY